MLDFLTALYIMYTGVMFLFASPKLFGSMQKVIDSYGAITPKARRIVIHGVIMITFSAFWSFLVLWPLIVIEAMYECSGC